MLDNDQVDSFQDEEARQERKFRGLERVFAAVFVFPALAGAVFAVMFILAFLLGLIRPCYSGAPFPWWLPSAYFALSGVLSVVLAILGCLSFLRRGSEGKTGESASDRAVTAIRKSQDDGATDRMMAEQMGKQSEGMWFEQLTGFPETSPSEVREKLRVEGNTLTSLVNGERWACGELEIVALSELRKRVAGISPSGTTRISEIVANVQDLHAAPENADSMFQVASQFNLLEMVGPTVTPGSGVGIYEQDFTQGPACAIAAGAGTVFRNYFAETNGEVGQTRDNQIDCLEELGMKLGNHDNRLWTMRNGYALASEAGLREISTTLRSADAEELEGLRGALKVGIQWRTQVTLPGCSHLVSQVYCSALPVAYSGHASSLWRDFAVLILEAAYEATLCAAMLNMERTGNPNVFLTLLGGGAFGNASDWIIGALQRALLLHKDAGLDVQIVSFGGPNPGLGPLVGASQWGKGQNSASV